MHCRACGCELSIVEDELCTLCELEYESYLDEVFERRGCNCHELDMESQPCAWCVNDMAKLGRGILPYPSPSEEMTHARVPGGNAVVGHGGTAARHRRGQSVGGRQ